MRQVEQDHRAPKWLDQIGDYLATGEPEITMQRLEEGKRLERVNCATLKNKN